jgi:hypothetical protein
VLRHSSCLLRKIAAPLSIIREENAFRFGKDALPPEEGAKLWAEFDAEMDRLYAIMNVGD